jgi:phosphoribosylformylglycinamidine synthase
MLYLCRLIILLVAKYMPAFSVAVDVMPHVQILDPRGKATENGLHQLGFEEVAGVRVGKHITFRLEAATVAEAEARARKACEQLLVNPIIERYELAVQPIA